MNLLRHQQLSVDQYGLTTQEITEGWQFCEESENGFLCNRNERSCRCNRLSSTLSSNNVTSSIRRDRLSGRSAPGWKQHLLTQVSPVQPVLLKVQEKNVVQEVLQGKL